MVPPVNPPSKREVPVFSRGEVAVDDRRESAVDHAAIAQREVHLAVELVVPGPQQAVVNAVLAGFDLPCLQCQRRSIHAASIRHKRRSSWRDPRRN